MDMRVLGEHEYAKSWALKLRVLEINLTKRETYILQFIQNVKKVLRTNLNNQGEINNVERWVF
jgi:hypothetical protein